MGIELLPEPPDRSVVLVGPEDAEQAYLRDDRGLKPDDLYRWWSLNGADESEVAAWAELLAKGPVERLYRPERLGDHIREARGYCTVCGHDHHETEWARIRNQVAGEARGDD